MNIEELLWKAHGDEATESNPRVFEIIASIKEPNCEDVDNNENSLWFLFTDMNILGEPRIIGYKQCECAWLGDISEAAIVHYFEDDSYEVVARNGYWLFTNEIVTTKEQCFNYFKLFLN